VLVVPDRAPRQTPAHPRRGRNPVGFLDFAAGAVVHQGADGDLGGPQRADTPDRVHLVLGRVRVDRLSVLPTHLDAEQVVLALFPDPIGRATQDCPFGRRYCRLVSEFAAELADRIEVVDNLTNHLDRCARAKVNRDFHAPRHAGIVASQ
jgi:hypothetical protein